jgi:hypothetical protein
MAYYSLYLVMLLSVVWFVWLAVTGGRHREKLRLSVRYWERLNESLKVFRLRMKEGKLEKIPPRTIHHRYTPVAEGDQPSDPSKKLR